MTNVSESTIEAEQDLDYSYAYEYTYGAISVGAVALATSTTTATVGAIGSGATTATADPQTTASSVATGTGSTTATASATTSAQAIIADATGDRPPVEFRVTRDGSTVEDAVYDVSPLVDTANPFGDYCVIKIDDRGGNKFSEYERGTRIDVDITINLGVTFTRRFTGYVVERRELDEQGADALEVEAYSFDQFLRRNTVSNDQTENTISEAFEDIITTDTPVDFNAAKVEVGENQTLTRSYRGEPVETVLRDLAFKSVNEEFGVDDDLEAFFRPRETEHIDRGVDNTQWFNYDIPELGKETINEVEVWFDDGNESVIVDDGTDKLDLQDSLGLSEPGTQRAELQRPLITDISDAEDIGRKYLEFRNATLSGTVTTFGLFDAEPGDTIDVTIDPRGIDEEFVIAATEYRWGTDETILTIVENRGNVDDILADLNDSVQRQEMAGADRDAPKNRITTTNARAEITASWDIDGTAESDYRIVNDGRNAIRDGWIGDGTVDVAEIRVGDSDAGLSRSNSMLVSQTATASTSQSLPDSTTVRFKATLTQTDVSEVGVFESDGTLLARATLDSAVDVDGTVAVDVSVANDDSVSRGVLTTGGQTVVRDIIADNNPAIPDEYAYGSDGSAVAESDTALGSEAVRVGLKEIEIQSADTDAEWNSITSFSASDPVAVQNDRFELLQASFTTESDDFSVSGTAFQGSITDFSNDSAERIEGGNFDSISITFTVDYTIPEADVGVWARLTTALPGNTGSGPGIEVSLNGDTWQAISDNAGFQTLTWRDLANDPAGTSETYSGGDLTPGTYTLTLEGTGSTGDGQDFDVLAPLDNRFSWTFDDDTTGTGERVEGPELYPDQYVQALSTALTRRLVDEARFDSTWNNITNKQFVELANDGSTFTRFNNSDSGTATFATQDEDIDTNIALSRFGTDTNATPTAGRQGQYIDEWDLFATVEAIATDDIGTALTRAIVDPNTITGTTIKESGLFGDGILLTHHELASFEVLVDQRLASSETTRFIGPKSRF